MAIPFVSGKVKFNRPPPVSLLFCMNFYFSEKMHFSAYTSMLTRLFYHHLSFSVSLTRKKENNRKKHGYAVFAFPVRLFHPVDGYTISMPLIRKYNRIT
ncbi:hypothetical protein FNH25_10040 [Morganella morganii]|nr:hypothetical protein [Morganella morganii]